MPASSNLAGIIAAASAGDPDLAFRQGVVVSWDASTGTNSVNVNGTLLQNLPALNLGEFVLLTEGDVVGLLRFKSTYFVLGRIIPPAQPDRSRFTVDYDSKSAGTTAWSLTTANASKVSLTFTPPSWAGEASLFVGLMVQAVNTTPNLDFMQIQPFVNGDDLPGITAVASGNSGSAFSTAVASTTITPTGPIVVEGHAWAVNADWGSSAGNGANLSVQVLYRRTS